MPVITLPDGSKREFDQPVTVAEIAASIGPGLAKAALGAMADGKQVDIACLIDTDTELSIITAKDEKGAGNNPTFNCTFDGPGRQAALPKRSGHYRACYRKRVLL